MQVSLFPFTDYDNIDVNEGAFMSYDIGNLKLLPLMFQTGYITILDI